MTNPRIALVGCGAWGKNLARALHQLGALALICDTSDSGQAAASKAAPGIPISPDPTAAWTDSIDAVAIATPAETHFALCRTALEHGKDVFVEKPITLHHAEAQLLVQLAAQRGRQLMVGHVLEYHPAVLTLRAMLQKGDLGHLHYIYSQRLNLGKIRREENALWSFAPHDIAIILRLVQEMPQQVSSCGGAYVQPNIADVTVTHLTFANGVQAHIFVSWLHPFKEQRLVVVGSRAMVVFDDVNKKLTFYDKRFELHHDGPVPINGDGREVPYPSDEPLACEMRAFISAVASHAAPMSDGASGARTLQVLEAAQASLQRQGQPVTLTRGTSNDGGATP